MHLSAFRLIALVLAVAAAAIGPAAAQAAPAPAPAFTLDLFSGKTLSLADLKGRAVVLLFWAEW
jgi:cytochrome oxidase Cu insertion factor (SCO1/SenC/PrrC family)